MKELNRDIRICPEYSNEELGKIIKEKSKMEKVTTVDIEGDPYNGYWYVCEECHGPVNWKDEKCPHCGWRLNWNG